MKSIFFTLALTVFAVYMYGENEPNNSVLQANNMDYNSTQSGNLSGTDNEDWFLINLPQGGIYTITIKKSGTGNGSLNLYDGEKTGNPEVTNIGLSYGNSPAGGWTLTSPLLAGKYYLKVVKNSGEINYEISGTLALPAFKEDVETNDTITKALNVQTGGTINGTLHYYTPGKGKDASDWYKMEIKTAGILKMKIHKKGSGSSTMYFRDENMVPGKILSNFFLSYGDSPAEGYSWNFAVLAGTYWILINGGDGVVDYQFETLLEQPGFTNDQEPNDTIAKAINVQTGGTISGTLHYYAPGKGKDEKDWFKMEIKTAGILKMKIHKKGSGSTTMYFRDENMVPGKMLSNFFLSYGNSPAEGYSWNFAVLAGTYWILLEGGDGVVDYQFETLLEQPAFNSDQEPNDTIIKALNVQAGGTINGTLHYYYPGKGKDASDWYKMEIKNSGIIKMKLYKKGSGNTTMYFRDENRVPGKVLSNFYLPYGDSPAEGYSWNFAVLAGTYWILINGGDGVVDYQLVTSLDKPAWPEDKENNDSIRLASEFLLNDSISGVVYYHKPGVGFDQTDYYKIVTPEYGQLSIQLSKKGIYGGVKLTDISKDILNQGFTYGDAEYIISKLLPAGTYYLVFQHSSNWLQYKAAMKFTPKPAADFSYLTDGYSTAFDNTTRFGETYSWSFDDGTKSTQVNPYHNYSKPGEYDICLVANNVAGKDTACKRFTIPGVERYFPNEGGNTGEVTVEVHGGGLDTSFVGYLKKGSETVTQSEYTYFAGKSAIKLTFNLREKPEGIYDLILEKGGGPTYSFPGGFKIVTGTGSDPWVNISGRNRMLFNTWTPYTVNYGNTGNVDAIMTPVWLVFSNKPGLEVELTDLEFANPFADSIPEENLAIEQEMIFGVPKQAKVYSVIIPTIPAKSTNSFTIKIKSDENLEVMVWNGKPLYQSPFNPLIGQCITQSHKWLDEKEFMVPEDDLECFLMLFQNYFNYVRNMIIKVYADEDRKISTNKLTTLSFRSALKRALSECRIDSRDKETVKALLFALWLNNNIINPPQSKKSAEIDTSQVDCYSEFKPNHLQTTNIRTVSSLDPNEKTGLYGFGPDNFAAGAKDLSYTVFFENLSTASAPAHTISITDLLDKNKFNLSTFSFGNIRVGDSLIYIQPGQKSFVVNKMFANRNTVARITGEIDTLSGKVEWKFRSLDPVTLADIEDPDVGLLPPNLVSPSGEGNVSFSVGLKKNPVHGETITNEAAIVFDSNPAIQTNKHRITFDLNAPESKVLPLAPSTTSNEFEVKWSGSDQGSGLQSYNIFVSANNEPYMLWIGGTTQTSATFKSTSDKDYKFISLSADNVGNREIVPEVADAEISVVTHVFNPETGNGEFSVFPIPAREELFFKIPEDGNFRITVYAGDGRLVFEKQITNKGLHSINVTGMTQGLYMWKITGEQNSFRKSGKFIVEDSTQK